MTLDGYIGDLLKEIRIGKNLTQNDICKGNLSRTFLSKIENNLSSPTFFTLQQILLNLDISLSELDFLNNQLSEKEDIINSFWNIKDNTDTPNLNKVRQKCIEYEYSDYLISDIKTLCEVMLELPNLSYSTTNCICKIKISKIWERLNLMNMWTLNELKLASCCLFYFPLDISTNIAKRVQKELEKYLSYDSKDIQIFILGQYINLCTLFLGDKDIATASILNKQALILAKNNNRYDYYYFCLVRSGIISKDIDCIIKGMSVLEQLEQFGYVQILKNEISNLLHI